MSEKAFRIVVLTCSELGMNSADYLDQLPEVEVSGLFWAPHPRAPFRRRLRRLLKNRGPWGTARFITGKMMRLLSRPSSASLPQTTPLRHVPIHHVGDFHAENCLRSLRDLQPDLAVVDGTYILKESVFDLPRLGSINLHCGKVPEFRGMPPGFWELFQGVNSVGVTIHRVAARLDAGPILAEASFPFDTTPNDEPMRYIDHYWRTVLRPNGIRMLGEVVGSMARGNTEGRLQPLHDTPPNRTPTWKEIRELRRRLRERRSRIAAG